MRKINILGIEVDQMNLDQATKIVKDWVKSKGKRYIVTPNVEFIMAAQDDLEFKKIINQADLKIPDSSRLGWAIEVLQTKSRLKKLLLSPFALMPKIVSDFPVTTGTDLMDKLCQTSNENGFRIGLLGGRDLVAKRSADCLVKKYPDLNIVFAEPGPHVNIEGSEEDQINNQKLPTMDLLFVAFGQSKQEKWIYKNLNRLPVKVAMGVGGAFDYISGQIPRAPMWMRNLGLEWLYRLIKQPWRIRRQLRLLEFIYLVVVKS